MPSNDVPNKLLKSPFTRLLSEFGITSWKVFGGLDVNVSVHIRLVNVLLNCFVLSRNFHFTGLDSMQPVK